MGVVAAKDLPEEPSEEEFRLGLRSGMILCNVLNKVVPGAVPKVGKDWFFLPFVIAAMFLILLSNFQLLRCLPSFFVKVVETPGDSVIIPDGAALSAYQYFENVRNFLVALQDMGLPTFEASDLEQVGIGFICFYWGLVEFITYSCFPCECTFFLVC